MNGWMITAWIFILLTVAVIGTAIYIWLNRKCHWCQEEKQISRGFKELCGGCEHQQSLGKPYNPHQRRDKEDDN